ncbi:MAG: GntR family transcriptional regulator [Armatimonadota bacterium]|nr:GntR family transcriptional regulator [Armatimonadota bacterium]
MVIAVDPEAPTPVYRQIVSQLRRAIAGGEIAPGDSLPTVRHLADELGVNFNTVANAYRALAEEGLVETHQGRGARVIASSKPKPDDAAAREALGSFLAEMVLADRSDEQILTMVEEALREIREGGEAASADER